MRPDAQFIGIEIRGYLVDKMSQVLALDPQPNVHVLLANVKEHLALLFEPGLIEPGLHSLS